MCRLLQPCFAIVNSRKKSECEQYGHLGVQRCCFFVVILLLLFWLFFFGGGGICLFVCLFVCCCFFYLFSFMFGN